MQPASVEDRKYYWRNAQLLIDWVWQHYQPLLSSESKAFYLSWHALADDEQALLVRMLSRKGDFFRQRQLQYDELASVDLSASDLLACGLIELDPPLDSLWLANFATVAELATLVKKAKKPDMVAAFVAKFSGQQVWSHCFADQPLVKLACRSAFDEFRLLFFGNLQQTLSDFIFAELGVQQWLPVAVDQLCLAFDDRQTIELAKQTHALGQALEQDQLSLAWLDKVPEQPAWLANRYRRRLFQLGYKFERTGEIAPALACYRASQTPDANIRQLRVLERQGDYQQASQLCQQMLAAPSNEAEHDSAQKVAKRLNRHGCQLPIVSPGYQPEQFQITLPERPAQLELAVAQALGEQVYYVENGVWQTLFFLTFADAILAPVQGAFFHPFQRQPMDLYQADFGQRRASVMQQCWQQLNQQDWPQRMAIRLQAPDYAAVRALAAPCNDEVAIRFARQAPRNMFVSVFERMWFDLRQNRAGFPDLMALGDTLRFYEVKGPTDQLQPHQRAWLSVLNEFVTAQVVNVRFDPSL